MPVTWALGDFETACGLDLKKVGAWKYAEDPTLEVFNFGYQFMDKPKQLWHPADGLDPDLLALVENDMIMWVAFNVQFEKAVWRNYMMALGYPDIPNERWHDVQAVCAMKVLPQALENAVIALRLPGLKDKEASKFTVGLSRPNKKGQYNRTPEALKVVDGYVLDDIDAEVGLHNRIGWLPPGERRVWLLNQKINERGLRIDLPFIQAAQRVVDRDAVPLLQEFAGLTGGLKPTQNEKFKDWLAAHGCKVGSLDKEHMTALLGVGIDGEDEDAEVYDPGAYVPVLSPDVRRALVIRSLIGSSSVKKLARMEMCICSDGRAKGLLQYHGTGPGRSAGRLFQPHNFPRGTVKIGTVPPDPQTIVDAILSGDPEFVRMIVGSRTEADGTEVEQGATEIVVSALRYSLIPEDDRVFIAGDYAGIQARTVLGLAGQHDKTALMASGADIYINMAEQIYKRKIDKKKDPAERQTGKNSVLGLGFQMGWRKFQFKYAKHESDEFCEKVVNVYRKEWAPLVPKVWYELQDAAVATVHTRTPHSAFGVEYRMEDRWLSARLPSGRKIWYFNPKPIVKAMPWDDTDIRQAFTYDAMKMGQMKTIDAFGGQLTENVVMGIERDLMTNAMLKCEDNGMPVVLEVHDEIVVEPLKVDADQKAFEQIMLDIPDWCKQIQIPVAVESWVGDRYRK